MQGTGDMTVQVTAFTIIGPVNERFLIARNWRPAIRQNG
jgi:hypothetical protein